MIVKSVKCKKRKKAAERRPFLLGRKQKEGKLDKITQENVKFIAKCLHNKYKQCNFATENK